MKKLKEKKVTTFLVGMILGIIIAAATSAGAAILYQSSQVSYSNSSSGLSSTNVQGAIDELSTKFSSSSSFECLSGPSDPIQIEGNSDLSLNLVSVRYCTGTGYEDLDGASFGDSSNVVGYISFDRGMSKYKIPNFNYITLYDDIGDYYDLSLTMEPYGIINGGVYEDSSNIYRFEIENLPSGDYTLTIGTAVMADNRQYLKGAPIVIEFTVV